MFGEAMNIRVTENVWDTPKVHDILEEFAREAGLKPDVLNQENFNEIWDGMVANKAAFMVLMEDREQVVGALGALIAPRVYWVGTMAAETFWFVKPAYRRGLGPVRMFKAFEQEAKRRGCAEVWAGHKTFFMAEQLGALYKALGYSPREVMYRKEI